MVHLQSTAVRSTVKIQETSSRLIVTVPIPNIAAENVAVRSASQAVLLWGEQMERVKIDGYCDFSYPAVQFYKLISLPHPIQPATVTLEFQTNLLTLTFLKQDPVSQ